MAVTTPDATLASKSTPNIAASDAVLHIHSVTLIEAPSRTVWDTLIDTSTWPSWNTFIPQVTIREQPDSDSSHPSPATLSPILRQGTRMTFHVQMDPSAPGRAQEVPLMVTEFEAPDAATKTPGRIVWVGDTSARGSLPGFLLTAERVHEVEEVDAGVTEVRNWEAQVGYLVYVVRWMYGEQLKKNFHTWVQDLKAYVEKQVAA
ncbi:hypothetical protein ATEIFO6365_0001081700 [Aspergillus terreus]|uniref:Uncharacterized protein n=1 Tax=Aspergillus terreus TaxID=33178 RepID=A0A5M3YMD5_ASPTE|nr:hypothetical protein ATETN484_0001073800 [Aspergillus terreus]GFF12594.1 hypothetical protein ATEIFO6365_0001081700 [Aspergillus terreus]